MKEKLLDLVIWGEKEEEGFALQIKAKGSDPKSFTLTKEDNYYILLAAVKAVAHRFDQVSGAVSTTEQGARKIDP